MIVYTIIGIPLMAMFLANIGGLMSKVTIWVYSRLCCRCDGPKAPNAFGLHLLSHLSQVVSSQAGLVGGEAAVDHKGRGGRRGRIHAH